MRRAYSRRRGVDARAGWPIEDVRKGWSLASPGEAHRPALPGDRGCPVRPGFRGGAGRPDSHRRGCGTMGGGPQGGPDGLARGQGDEHQGQRPAARRDRRQAREPGARTAPRPRPAPSPGGGWDRSPVTKSGWPSTGRSAPSGSLPEDAGFYLVSWQIDAVAGRHAEQALRHLDDQLEAIERAHGLDEGEAWEPGEAPPEYAAVLRRHHDAWDKISRGEARAIRRGRHGPALPRGPRGVPAAERGRAALLPRATPPRAWRSRPGWTSSSRPWPTA